MPTLRQLRLEARLSSTKLARLADVDRQTVVRAESGVPVQDVKAYAIVTALGKVLGRDLRLEDVDGLRII
jgi:DNA-binding XRE family transcriptional regulator